MVLTVHHLNNSRSQRILWLLEELGQEYEVKNYQRNPETGLAQDDLLELHPLGKAPLFVDGDVVIPESGRSIRSTPARRLGATGISVQRVFCPSAGVALREPGDL